MPRVLLSWEFGTGRGHVLMLKRFAAALGAPSLVDAALCSLDFAGELSGLSDTVIQGPGLVYDSSFRMAGGNPMTSTWGEYLGDLGFQDPAFMARQIGWWQDLIEERRIGLVIADYAPFAVLAARGLGIKVVGTGLGYGLGPAALSEFPVLIERFGDRIHDEKAMVAAVNEAAHPLGVPTLTRFPQINLMDDMLVQSLPFFDPYQALRDRPYLPPIAEAPSAPGGEGAEIFMYATGTTLDNAVLVEAVSSLTLPVRIHAPGATPEALARLHAAGNVTVEKGPVPIDDIATRSRLIIHAGQPGTMTMGLACGLAQVAVPQHLEHQFHAEKMRDMGTLSIIPHTLHDPAAIRETIMATYHAQPVKRRALELAREFTPLIRREARPMIRQRLNDVMMPR